VQKGSGGLTLVQSGQAGRICTDELTEAGILRDVTNFLFVASPSYAELGLGTRCDTAAVRQYRQLDGSSFSRWPQLVLRWRRGGCSHSACSSL
jgi:hypothetical protein